mmetsp:Transcript_36739/g.44925  ORF Transcript_36739/g.44925 Transcript_36739/m.44925 type:complete len:84 (+) Transcript_36739:40-291(+)
MKYGTAPDIRSLAMIETQPQDLHKQHNKRSIKYHFVNYYIRQRQLRAVAQLQTCDNRRKYVDLSKTPSQHDTPCATTALIWRR